MTEQAPSVRITGKAESDGSLLFDVSEMHIGAGEWTCLLGPSGVGKSTLLRLLAGLDTHVTFSGSIEASGGTDLSQCVSYMAQSDLLLPWASISANISLGSTLRGEAVDHDKLHQIIANVGLRDHADKHPAALSGGQRQRAALARTLMENTPMVLLDEPFSSLDAKTRTEMQELTSFYLSGKTVLLVTHDPGEAARLCHSIYILKQQRLFSVDSLSPPFPKHYADTDIFALQNKLLSQIRADAP
jgi:putative hydroxymethylpyrimidine transport system ATP-binding protein